MTKPVAAEAQRCPECGHAGMLNKNGVCTHHDPTCIKCGHRESRQIPKQCVDDECFCVCEFPAPQSPSKSVVKRLAAQTKQADPQSTPADEVEDLIAWKWANSLSQGEQSVLLSGNIKRLQHMITTALAEARRAQWLPIESVPKDGSEVLLGHGNSIWIDQWVTDAANEVRNGEGGYWMMCDQWSDPEIPSHWQSLPDPPVEAGREEGEGNG